MNFFELAAIRQVLPATYKAEARTEAGPSERISHFSTNSSVWKDRPFLLILIIAVLLRLATITLGTGSDEIVYIAQGEKLLAGDIGHSDYIGAIRYGVNSIEAVSLWLFGKNSLGASGLYFIFSILDLVLAYKLAYMLWGRRQAIWAAICLSTIPLHVVSAGDWLPDPWLVLVIDSSFFALYLGLRSRSSRWFALVGFLAGLVFWIKEAVSIYVVVIGILLLLYERRSKTWVLTAGVAVAMVSLNFLFFKIFYGDSLYLIRALSGAINKFYVQQDLQDTRALSYFFELFRWPYFAGYVGFIAAAGAFIILRRWWSESKRSLSDERLYVVIWGIGLLLVFSFLPISLHPLKFIAKQSNYMLIFTTPMCLLAGYALAAARRSVAITCGIVIVASGVFISTLDQQRWQLFTANGRAAVAFADYHRNEPIFGTRMIHRQSVIYSLLDGSRHQVPRICSVEELGHWAGHDSAKNSTALVIVDEQNLAPGLYYSCSNQRNPPDFTRLGTRPIEARLLRLPACWTKITEFETPPSLLGHSFIGVLRKASRYAPSFFARWLTSKTERYWSLHRAVIYSVTEECVRATFASTPNPIIY